MRFLIIAAAPDVAEALQVGLAFEWPDAQIETANDEAGSLRLFQESAPDMTLLDLDSPGLGGFALVSRLRHISDAPLLLLSTQADEMIKVHGLDLGADDYLVKPFGHLELFARIKAILRRTVALNGEGGGATFQTGDLLVNFASHETSLAGAPVKLTPTEYRLLYQLVRNAGRVLTCTMLLNSVWGKEFADDVDYLKTYISRLRKKLHDDPAMPRYILTERAVGYRFARPVRPTDSPPDFGVLPPLSSPAARYMPDTATPPGPWDSHALEPATHNGWYPRN